MQKKFTIPKPQYHCTIKNIAIFGSADVDEKHPLYEEVFRVSRHLALNGKCVVNGGGPGVMAAATEGAESVDGETLTVTLEPTDMPEFEGKSYKNIPDKEIKTAHYVERLFGLMDNADAFICFQGGTGTLSEWATAWLLAHLYYGNHKPLILYGEFWKDLHKVVEDHFFIGQKELEVYKIVTTEDGIISALREFEEELATRCELPPKEK